MIRFNCPACGKHLSVAAGLAGKTGKCSGCGKPIKVPAEEPVITGHGQVTPPPVIKTDAQTDSATSTFDPLDSILSPDPAAVPQFEFEPPNGNATNGATAVGGLPNPAAATAPVFLPLNTPSASNLASCTDCGELISIRAHTCPRCGCPIAPETTPIPVDVQWKSATLQPTILGGIISAIGAAGVAFFVLGFETSVPVEGLSGIHRVQNLGLANVQLIGVIIFTALFLFGRFPSRITFTKVPAS